MKWATAWKARRCRPLRGLNRYFSYRNPGACAPGFILPPALRARRPDMRLRRGEFFGHADEVGEGAGVHFLHYLAAVEFDGDFARA